MLRNSLRHAAGTLDPVHALRFLELGLIEGGRPTELPEPIADILAQESHPNRIPAPDGSLLFLLEGQQSITVVEVAALLLYPEMTTRMAALRYFERAGTSSPAWLTPHTCETLRHHAADLQSDQATRWRGAGIEVATSIRADILGHLASLRQSLIVGYEPGINKHNREVLFPTFKTLANFRPPLWSVNEQRQELKGRIQNLAKSSNLAVALSAYVEQCGYVPLCEELSASELVRQWVTLQSPAELSWSEIWTWATNHGSPLVRFHACEIAIGHWSQFSEADKKLIPERVSSFVTELMAADGESEGATVWRLRNELAAHYLRHIETLHPCQDSERAACLAYWLADKAACVIGQTEKKAAYWLDNVLPRAHLENHVAWQAARTPIQPSSIRYITLYRRSVWVPSLVGRIVDRLRNAPEFQLSADALKLVVKGLHVERVAGLIGSHASPSPAYAFEETGHLRNLSVEDQFTTAEDHDTQKPVVEFRRELMAPERLLPWLRRTLELSVAEQYLLMVSFREIATVTAADDDAVADWLTDTSLVVEILQRLPTEPLIALLDALEEFQLRRLDAWGVRLPHLLGYAIERCDDVERAKELAFVLCRLSLNCGIASPIQRIMATHWRGAFVELLQMWRCNLQCVAKVVEPWVAGRIRATSSALSRLIGPQQDHSPPSQSDQQADAPISVA